MSTTVTMLLSRGGEGGINHNTLTKPSGDLVLDELADALRVNVGMLINDIQQRSRQDRGREYISEKLYVYGKPEYLLNYTMFAENVVELVKECCDDELPYLKYVPEDDFDFGGALHDVLWRYDSVLSGDKRSDILCHSDGAGPHICLTDVCDPYVEVSVPYLRDSGKKGEAIGVFYSHTDIEHEKGCLFRKPFLERFPFLGTVEAANPYVEVPPIYGKLTLDEWVDGTGHVPSLCSAVAIAGMLYSRYGLLTETT